MKNGCQENIIIADQNLGCYGELKNKRFGLEELSHYDGIHMRGKLGVQHYTGSFANFLLDTLPQFHDMKNKINITPSNIPPPSYPRSYSDNVRHGRPLFHNVYQPQQQVPRYRGQQYNVPTQNRFSAFQSGN